MKIKKSSVLAMGSGCGLVLSGAALVAGNAAGEDAGITGGRALQLLTAAHRGLVAKGQHPFAIIVGCSDSRVPGEIIFD